MFKQFSRLWLKSLKQLVKAPASRRTSAAKTAPAGRKSVSRKAAAVCLATSDRWRRHTYVAGPDDVLAGVRAGRRIDYWLFRPSASASEPLPLLVMLHGCGQSAVEFASGTRMNRLAESQGFAVLYPQQAQSAQRQRCWPWYRKEIQEGGGEARMITAIMRKVVAQHGFDPARVYCAGLSAGAAMAHIIALRYPQLVAAVALHSGPMFGAAHSSVSGYGVMQHGSMQAPEKMLPLPNTDNGGEALTMPALLIHGRQDTVVRVVNLQQLEQQFCALNRLTNDQRSASVHHPAGRTKRSAQAYDTVDYRRGRKAILRVCRIDHLDHAWSGGDGALRFNAARGPDASRMIWRFVSAHRRAAPLPTVAG